MFSAAIIAALSLGLAGLGYWLKRLLTKVGKLELENEIASKEKYILENEANISRTLYTDDDIARILRDKSAAARKLEAKSNK